MTSWLSRHKKSDLIDLADDAGLKLDENLRKDEMVTELAEYLRANATTLAHQPQFSSFFERSSPSKRERSPQKKDVATVVITNSPAQGTPNTVSPAVRRRKSVKQEPETQELSVLEPSNEPRTPAIQRVARRVALPASPALVADVVERQTAVVKRRFSQFWANSGVTEKTHSVRENLSSVAGVESAAILLEAWGLQRVTLPWIFMADTPHLSAAGFSLRSYPIYAPDFFRILTGAFWSQSLLWASTSLFAPMFFAYFFNFTLNAKASSSSRTSKPAYRFDPMTFNVMKALVTWLVYAKGIQFGLISNETISAVDGALPGGYQGVLIGSGIGALISVYEAVLKK